MESIIDHLNNIFTYKQTETRVWTSKNCWFFSSGTMPPNTFCYLFPWGLESLHGLHVEQISHVAIIHTIMHYLYAVYCINHIHPCSVCSLCCASYISFTACTGQGSHTSSKVLEFLLENFQNVEGPGKWPWSWKVLEIYLQGPGKSWKLYFLYTVSITSVQKKSQHLVT